MRGTMRLGLPMGMVAILAMAGCSEGEASTAAQDRADAKAVAQVMAQQTPPPVELEIQPILYDDIIRNPAMEEGPGCSFTPAGEEDPFAVMAADGAYVKYDGSIQRLAPDAGSAEGPSGSRAKYDGREYALKVSIDEAAKEDGEGEGYWFAPATITFLDGYEREVASAEGRVGCGG